MATIRLATPADAQGILSIYAPYIQNTSITFDTEVPSVDVFAGRIETHLHHWPWLVCQENGMIIGYAYASRHRERVAYQWSVECSVYIHDDYIRAGVAKALYTALFKVLQLQGFRNVYAVINLPNDRSVAFHEHMGFRYFATYEQVGYKLGRWKDIGWWRLILNEFNSEPQPPVFLAELDKSGFSEIFAKAEKLLKKKNNINHRPL